MSDRRNKQRSKEGNKRQRGNTKKSNNPQNRRKKIRKKTVSEGIKKNRLGGRNCSKMDRK